MSRYSGFRNNTLDTQYNLSFPDVEVPMGDAYKREMMVIMAPLTDTLTSDMDANQYTGGLTPDSIKILQWNSTDAQPKPLDLEINERFLVIARVYGRFENTLKSSTKAITFSCKQSSLFTLEWKCDDGRYINASLVCNTIPDCEDKSDESKKLCMLEIESLWFFVTSYLSLSIIVNLIASIIRFRDDRKNEIDEELIKEIDDTERKMNNLGQRDPIDGKENDVFQTIFVCSKNIQERINNGDEITKKDEDLNKILELFMFQHHFNDKIEHQLRNDLRAKSLHKLIFTLRNIRESQEFSKSVELIVDKIHELEHRVFHSTKEESGDFVKDILKSDYSTSEFYISVRERNGFFGKIKQKTATLFHKCFGQNVILASSVIITLMLSIKDIVIRYYNMYIDIIIGAGIHHVRNNFITSIGKSRLIEFLDLNVLRYYYPSLCIVNMLLIHLYYFKVYKKFSFYGPRRMQKIITLISFVFPFTFIVMENCRALIIQLIAKQKMANYIQTKAKATQNDQNQKYFEMAKELRDNDKYSKEIFSILITCLVIQMVGETLPQVITVISFLITEYYNDFGPLKYLFMISLVKNIGINAPALCFVLVGINIAKLSTFALGFDRLTQHPMNIGIIGSILRLASMSMLIWSKIFLCGVIVRLRPYSYPALLFLEFSFITIHSKLTQTKTDYFFSVLPATFSACLFNNENTKPNFWWLRRYFGVLNSIIIHYGVGLLIYFPVFYTFNQINYQFTYQNQISFSMNNLEKVAFAWYGLSVFPYFALSFAYYHHGQRFKELYVSPYFKKDTAMEDQSEMLSEDDINDNRNLD